MAGATPGDPGPDRSWGPGATPGDPGADHRGTGTAAALRADRRSGPGARIRIQSGARQRQAMTVHLGIGILGPRPAALVDQALDGQRSCPARGSPADDRAPGRGAVSVATNRAWAEPPAAPGEAYAKRPGRD